MDPLRTVTRARLRAILLGFVGAAGVIVLWELVARSAMASSASLPAPSEAIAGTLRTVPLDVLAGDVAASLKRVAAGFAIAVVAGSAIGLATGWLRWFDRLFTPIVELLRPIPPLAWIPLAIIWFGLAEGSKIFVVAIAAFFPVWTQTHRGLRGVDPTILRAARTQDVAGARLFAFVALPAALPDIATGLRVAWGLAFGILVAAELVAARQGLGYMIMNGRQLGEMNLVVTGILIIGTLSLLTDALLGLLLRASIRR